MPRTSLIAAVLATLAVPAQAEGDSAETAWSMFSEHCPKFLTATTLAEISAAFGPHETKIFATVDGAIQSGTAQIEDLGVADATAAYFQTFTTRLDGGTMRSCALQVLGGADMSISGLAALVQEKAADILGAGHSVQGGPIVTTEGPEGITLYLASPGFPPEKAIQMISTNRFASITVQTMTAE